MVDDRGRTGVGIEEVELSTPNESADLLAGDENEDGGGRGLYKVEEREVVGGFARRRLRSSERLFCLISKYESTYAASNADANTNNSPQFCTGPFFATSEGFSKSPLT